MKRKSEGKSDGETYFSMGLGTYKVPMSLHADNRAKVVAAMRSAGHTRGVLLLQGGEQKTQYDTDTEIVFRQESYFNYLFGVKEPDWYGCIDLGTGQTTLFIPRLPETYSVWQGAIKKPDYFQAHYAVDDVRYTDELQRWMTSKVVAEDAQSAEVFLNKDPIFLLFGKNSDSGNFTVTTANFEGLKKFKIIDKSSLHPILANARVRKSPLELKVMQYVSLVSSLAHVEVMRAIKPGMTEFQLESLFKHHTYTHGGCRHMAYTCICACGPNAAVLHYGHAGAPNDRVLQSGDIALIDMGAEYHCYCSDITCSYPVSGKFSEPQQQVYEGVLKAQKVVMDSMRPGVSWADMHRAATRVVLETLVKVKVLKGSVEELAAAGLGPIFLPCGLGHFIGMDTHDVGGYLQGYPERILEDGPSYGISKLRTARVLEEGMVLTVEPGIYFIDAMLDKALSQPDKARFFDDPTQNLAKFRGWGGVRLEDVVAVTSSGIQNFTISPRTVVEVESVMAGGKWPPDEYPAKDPAPWLCRQWPN